MQTDLMTMLSAAPDEAPQYVPDTDRPPVQPVPAERLFMPVQTIPGQLALGDTDR